MIVDERTRYATEILERYAAGERDFTGLDITDGGQRPPSFRGAVLDGADFSRSFVEGDFTGASLRGARFVGANVKTCIFDGADLHGADFRGASLEATSWQGCALDGVDFEGGGMYSHVLAKGERPA